MLLSKLLFCLTLYILTSPLLLYITYVTKLITFLLNELSDLFYSVKTVLEERLLMQENVLYKTSEDFRPTIYRISLDEAFYHARKI
jgi:hypothetical protein